MSEHQIQEIIQALDKYIEESGKEFLHAPEANRYLENIGLLDDREEREGNPLRKLLRAGQIPHAYQVGRTWFIPHSSMTNKATSSSLEQYEIEEWARLLLRYLVFHVLSHEGGDKYITYGNVAKKIGYPGPYNTNKFGKEIGQILGVMGHMFDEIIIEGRDIPLMLSCAEH